MKNKFKNLLIIATLIFISGCAGKEISIVPIDLNQNSKIFNSSIGVAVLTPNNELEFAESKYKVLYYEMAESFFSYDGLWDPAPELTKQCMQTLHNKFNMETISLSSEVDPLIYEKYIKNSEKIFDSYRKRYKGTGSTFVSGFGHEYINNNSYLTSKPNEDILKAAHKLNLQYIMEIPLTGVSIYSHCFNQFTNFHVYAHARLISVPDGKIIWAHKGTGYSKITEKISLNNLKAIDTYYTKTTQKLCNPNTPLVDGLSMVYNSYLFNRLLEDLAKK